MIDRWNINLCILRKGMPACPLSMATVFFQSMDPLYRESRPILPRNLAYLVAVVLIATLAFMVFSQYVLDTRMPSWTIPVSAVLFIVIIAVVLILRMDVVIHPDRVEIVYAFRRTVIGRDEIIDVRRGDLTEIRNYGGWNLKGVRHRTFSRIGDDDGVALKITGKRVVVFSTEDPEHVFGLIPRSEAPSDDPVPAEDGKDGE